jgi:CRISPR-associated protein Cas1
MIKRTLYFGNPAYLSFTNGQLVIRKFEIQEEDCVKSETKKTNDITIPVEDIGIVVLDHKQITITQGLIAALVDNNVAIITCNDSRHPTGLLMPLDKNEIQNQRFRAQIEATVPLKKNLWQQTVQTKIINQAMVLKGQGVPHINMFHWARNVKSGDTDNHEARAAAYYWSKLFGSTYDVFKRDRNGEPPNNLLNYGYAILRAIVARGLVGSGLLPTLGIHHRNKYNAYCLADDIMEPYRPYVDEVVLNIVKKGAVPEELTKELKAELLKIPILDVEIERYKYPLMVGMQRTTASLAKCFEGELRKIVYPQMM